ncbi:hypothetical protein D918_07752 [Trichuris suis]
MQAPTKFEIALRFRCLKPAIETVTFKVDGGRFPTSSRTMKLYRDTCYDISITSTPGFRIEDFEVNGESMICEPNPDGSLLIRWSTAGFGKTKSRKRNAIRLTFRGAFGELNHNLQCKFYDSTDSHALWGDKFVSMKLECSTGEAGFASVVQEELK